MGTATKNVGLTINPYTSGTELGGEAYFVKKEVFTFSLNGQSAGNYYAYWRSSAWVAGIVNGNTNAGNGGSWGEELQVAYTSGTASAGPTMLPATIDIIGRGYPYTQNLNSVDPDGTPVTYTNLVGNIAPHFAPLFAIPGMSVSSVGGISIPAVSTSALSLGRYQYKVKVTDGSGGTGIRDVLVVVEDPTGAQANTPPVLSPIGSKTTSVNTPLNFTVSASDPDSGQTITLRSQLLPNGAAFPQTSGPASGTSATFSWTPVSGQEGTYNVNFDVYDSGAVTLTASELVQITVTGSNHPPVLTAIPNQVIANGGSVSFTASATDQDAGQTITYQLFNGPSGATLNLNTGAFSWTPTAGQYNSTFSNITVRAIDNGAPNLFADQSFSVTVGGGNHPPVTSTANLSVTALAGQALSFVVNGNDADAAPVPVVNTGALAGRTVIALTAGHLHSLALCSDGTVAAWGYNGQGQLGSGGGGSTVPVAVDGTGVFSGKVVTAVSAGRYQSLALCADSTLAAWGYNANGQLGNNSTASSPVPVPVDRTGVLLGKTVGSIASGFYHSLVLCTDGTLAAWGDATYGELGNGSTVSSLVPVAVSTASLLAGESFAKVASGQSATHTLALAGAAVTTVAATSVTSTTATLNGTVNANGTSTAVSFDYGGVGYGTNVAGTPTPVTGSSPTAVAFSLTGLSPVTTYHFRVNGVSAAGTANGGDLTFTTPGTTPQTITFTNPGPHVVTDAPFALNASASPSGLPVSFSIVSGPATVSGSTLTITGVGSVTVRASQAGNATYDAAPNVNQTFTVTAVPPSGLSYSTNPATYLVNVPISNNTPSVGGGAVVSYSVSPALPAGLSLDTGTGVISGTPTAITASAVYTVTATNGGGFTNAGVRIRVVSNDAKLSNLVPDSGTLTPAFASGTVNYTISVPNATASISVTPTVNQAGATVKVNTVTVASGSPSGAMALSVGTNGINVVVTAQDGVTTKTYTVVVTRAALPSGVRLLAWGYDSQGQLGINSTTGSPAPVAVDATGALAGKTIVGMSTGALHNLALCSDGTLIAWGYNGDGEFGNGSTTGSLVPVAIPLTGALVGKTITAVAAGDYHSLVLCSDGTVVGWGYNGYGQIGNNSTAQSNVPVAVSTAVVLSGKTVSTIAAGYYHSVALCSDGTLAAWGDGTYGELGTNSTASSLVPVAVSIAGLAAGEHFAKVATGQSAVHTLALTGTAVVP